MNNGHGGYGHNMFMHGYRQYQQNSVPFRNNELLTSNPQLRNTYDNVQFQQHLQMARMRRLQKAKMMENVKVSEEEMTNYVIGPMKIQRASKSEIEGDHRNLEGQYVIDKAQKGKKKKGKKQEYDVNPYLKKMWDNRTNQPYKRIMHRENWNRNFDEQDDLIVHKVSKKDKNKKKLKKAYRKLRKLMKEENKQIEEIYSEDKEVQHMRNFQYSHVYKYRLKHKSNNHEDMKKIYKKEQRKLNRERNEIQSALTMLLNSDVLPDKDRIALEKELSRSSKKMLKRKKYKLKSVINDEMSEIKGVLGNKEFKKLVKESDKALKKERMERRKLRKKKKEKIRKKKKEKKKKNKEDVEIISNDSESMSNSDNDNDNDINVPVINLKKIVIKDNIKPKSEHEPDEQRNNDSGSDSDIDDNNMPQIKLKKIPVKKDSGEKSVEDID